ncbi:hypothetical protein [Saccharothrix variisporea]|uniref:hypothetical protein n=1 Tax=Saccharothrix variisporea TaxID=543527 RepID=UPI0011C44C73|nr:hypothetical protein [Saccharothrix variisporea]
MPRLPLPLLSFTALAVLAGVVTAVALIRADQEPPREQRVGTSPVPTQRAGGDGPPMDFEGAGVSVTTSARAKVTTTATTVGTQTTTTQITSTTTDEPRQSVTVPELTVSVPVSTSSTELEVPTAVSGA